MSRAPRALLSSQEAGRQALQHIQHTGTGMGTRSHSSGTCCYLVQMGKHWHAWRDELGDLAPLEPAASTPRPETDSLHIGGREGGRELHLLRWGTRRAWIRKCWRLKARKYFRNISETFRKFPDIFPAIQSLESALPCAKKGKAKDFEGNRSSTQYPETIGARIIFLDVVLRHPEMFRSENKDLHKLFQQ